MARTKTQERARLRRLERAAEVLYVQAKTRDTILVPETPWDSLDEAEKSRYRTLAEMAVEAFEARSS